MYPSFNDGYSLAELITFARQHQCPKCHAPSGAPCADLRSYDKNLYGVRTHRERRQQQQQQTKI